MVCYFYSVSRLLIWYDLSQRRWNNKLYLLLLKTKPLVSHVAASLCFFNSYLQNSTRGIFRTSVALRNQYAFISFHSVLFQLGIFFFILVDWKSVFEPIKKAPQSDAFTKYILTAKRGRSSSDDVATIKVFVREPKQRCVTSFYFPPFPSLMSSQCDSPHDSIQTLLPQRTERSQPPIEASLQGFSSHRGRRGGGEGESLAPSDRSPTAEAFVTRLITLGDVAEPGGLWPDLHSEGPGGQRGWNGEKWKDRANLVGRKDGNGGRGDCGGTAWNKVFRNRSTSISFFLLSL